MPQHRGRPGSVEDWFARARGGTPACSNFTYSGPFTEMVLLGNVAIPSGQRKLLWNTKAMKFTNAPDANQYIKRKNRKGWG